LTGSGNLIGQGKSKNYLESKNAAVLSAVGAESL
jgi:hypothetical protein